MNSKSMVPNHLFHRKHIKASYMNHIISLNYEFSTQLQTVRELQKKLQVAELKINTKYTGCILALTLL
jgi:hypothetical protein